MSEFILPAESKTDDFSNVTAFLGVPLDIYRGTFIDGLTRYKVIIDTDYEPIQEPGGELYGDPLHDVFVYETTVDDDGATRKEVPTGDMGYPFSDRVELTKLAIPLSKILESSENPESEQ